MKKLTILFILLVSTVIFSSPSYAGWTRVSSSGGGANTFYVDFDRIRKVDGYVYYWYMTDHLQPTKYGDLSSKTYHQGDCKLFRYKILGDSYYTQPMGQGIPSTSSNKPDKEWSHPPPNSSIEAMLKSVCSR